MSAIRKRALVFALLVLVSFAGCASAEKTTRTRSVMVAMTATDSPPSARQVEEIHVALKPKFAEAGLSLAKKGQPADFIVTVRFTPSAGAGGARATIVGIEPTAKFREAAMGEGESPETKELRRRLQEYQRWIERSANEPI